MSLVDTIATGLGLALGSASCLIIGPRPTLVLCDWLSHEPEKKSNVILTRYDAIQPIVNLLGLTYLLLWSGGHTHRHIDQPEPSLISVKEEAHLVSGSALR